MRDPAKAIGEAILTRRWRLELTQRTLASAVGVTPSAVAHYEAGRNVPTYDRVVVIAEALGCKPSELLACLDGILDAKRTASIRRALAKARGT